jgi:hypothetical protein
VPVIISRPSGALQAPFAEWGERVCSITALQTNRQAGPGGRGVLGRWSTVGAQTVLQLEESELGKEHLLEGGPLRRHRTQACMKRKRVRERHRRGHLWEARMHYVCTVIFVLLCAALCSSFCGGFCSSAFPRLACHALYSGRRAASMIRRKLCTPLEASRSL